MSVSSLLEKILSDRGYVGDTPKVSNKRKSGDLDAIKKAILGKSFIVQPEAGRGAVVSIRELRTGIGIRDRSFDAAILQLASAAKIFLHKLSPNRAVFRFPGSVFRLF